MRNDDYREVPLTLAATLTLWAGAVAAATSAGIFARLNAESYLALAAFATVFAPVAVIVDARVRGWLAAHGMLGAWTAALGLAVLLVASGMALSGAGEPRLAQAPWAPILLFVLPVTLAAAVAAVRSAWHAGGARTGRAVGMAGD